MKTETILCDVCKNKVASIKCEFCEKDLCYECKRDFWFYKSEGGIISAKCCNNCFDIYKTIGITDFNPDFIQKFKEMMITELRKLGVLRGLKEKRANG